MEGKKTLSDNERNMVVLPNLLSYKIRFSKITQWLKSTYFAGSMNLLPGAKVGNKLGSENQWPYITAHLRSVLVKTKKIPYDQRHVEMCSV